MNDEILTKIQDIIDDTIELEYQPAPCGCCAGSYVISRKSTKLAAEKIYSEIIRPMEENMPEISSESK